ncbi:terpene synthase family protein [Planotetraspora sp. GP83]|uniref:terpene synthase family protein n=1 Tax=Planotetraspora sp. GP83 TaxID=3156264 RepID=UPI003515161F
MTAHLIGPLTGSLIGSLIGTGELAVASDLGRTCALAARSQRDLMRCAETYGELFPPEPFDAGFFSGLSLVGAFGSPWATAAQLRVVNRAALWVFAVDWLVDAVATSAGEVDALVHDCLAVADGDPPVGEAGITRFLADIRDELAAVPSFPVLRQIWADQVRRMLLAMAREWRWRSEATTVTFDDYLGNADSCGSSFVNVSHWIATGDAWTAGHLGELREISGEVQRYLRLLNDMATHGRELEWGDLNVLTLGVSRTEVTGRMAELVARCRALIDPVRAGSPRTAAYLERQIGFNTGFYGLVDYWGERCT